MTPDEFIPVAEETGLIATLGRLVLREACRQLAEWRAPSRAPDDLTMAVNISGRQLLEPPSRDDVDAALADHGIEPDALRLEITETAASADAEAVRDGARAALRRHRRARAPRRLRDRRRVADRPARLPGRRAEDRPLVRGLDEHRPGRAADRARRRRARARARDERRRRGRRDRLAARAAARAATASTRRATCSHARSTRSPPARCCRSASSTRPEPP